MNLRRLAALWLCLCTALAGAAPASAAWWRHAVFYEIYTRSFQDSDGDGLGDLKGITSRLDYLRDLGIDAIWLTPCYPSPMADGGYDIMDYENIDPRLGTLQDFDRLVAEGRKRGIRVLMDLVLNHTSDQHPWFKDSRSSRHAPKRDWFIWRDAKGPGLPPCNWLSLFGGPAWTLDPATNQYYYHFFYKQQPDLNWRNPEVRGAMLDVARWWLRRGAAGFRLDAVDTLFEDPRLHDNPLLPGLDAYGEPNMKDVYNYKLDEKHVVLKDLRRITDEADGVLIGETYTESTAELRSYYGNGEDELQMPTGHMLAMAKTFSPTVFRDLILATARASPRPVWVLNNHDLPRSTSRYGDGLHNDAIAKILATLLFTLRGVPILYYGEELGMVNCDAAHQKDVLDRQAVAIWPPTGQRCCERTPMPWDATPQAGFTTGRPWMPLLPRAATHNVATESRDPESVLAFYRRLTALRRTSRALLDGDYQPLDTGNPDVLSYLRTCGDERVLVVLNFTGEKKRAGLGLHAPGAKVLLSCGEAVPAKGVPEELGPYGIQIMSLGI